MKTLDQWLSQFAQTHQNKTNCLIHVICIPTIFFSIAGILWSLPKAFLFPTVPNLNWAHIAALPVLLFYARLGLKPFLIMFSTITVTTVILQTLSNLNFPHLTTYIVIYAIAWTGQFYGHYLEGKKPSFFSDIQFLLIGPLWVFYYLFKRV